MGTLALQSLYFDFSYLSSDVVPLSSCRIDWPSTYPMLHALTLSKSLISIAHHNTTLSSFPPKNSCRPSRCGREGPTNGHRRETHGSEVYAMTATLFAPACTALSGLPHQAVHCLYERKSRDFINFKNNKRINLLDQRWKQRSNRRAKGGRLRPRSSCRMSTDLGLLSRQ